MWIFLYIYIALTSILVLPINNGFLFPKEMVFFIGGMTMLSLPHILQKPKYDVFSNRYIGLILLYVVLSFGWYFYMPMLKMPIKWNLWNYLPTINVILTIFLIQSLIEHTDHLQRWLDVSKFLCWFAFILSIYAIIQFCGLDQIFDFNFNWTYPVTPHVTDRFVFWRMITFFGNPKETATFLTIIAPLCLMFKDFRYKVFYLTIIFAVILTKNDWAFIYLGISIILYFLFTKKIRLSGLLFLLFSAFYLYLYFNNCQTCLNLHGKLGLWKEIWLSGCKKLFTGSGLGSFGIKNFAVGVYPAKNAMFDLLQIFHDGGIILVGLIIAYLLNLAKRIYLAKKNMLLIGYTISFITFLCFSVGAWVTYFAPCALLGILNISAIETIVSQKEE